MRQMLLMLTALGASVSAGICAAQLHDISQLNRSEVTTLINGKSLCSVPANTKFTYKTDGRFELSSLRHKTGAWSIDAAGTLIVHLDDPAMGKDREDRFFRNYDAFSKASWYSIKIRNKRGFTVAPC